MKKTIYCFLLALFVHGAMAQTGEARVKEYLQEFPTYPFSDPDPIPLNTNVYPYFRYDGFTNQVVMKKWKVVALENDYIQLLILPEIGGKIWAAIEKSTGKPFIYYNHVVKFRDIAMRGPWTSGGLEANFGIIGHTPNCATPVDYLIQHNPDGSISCYIGVLDLLTRSNWRMEINLPKDKAYFTTRSFWYNTTPTEQPYYHWMNAGLKAGDDLEFIYPGNKYLGHDGEYAAWPVNPQGKRLNWYRENNFGGYKSYHVFGKYTHFTGAYWHKDNLGMVRFGHQDDKAGKKIWIWGLSRQGMIWEKLLTDTDGQYVELQSGRLFNQNTEKSSRTPFKHISLTPYASESWKEYWYPVLATQGISVANENGAFHFTHAGSQWQFTYCPTVRVDDTISIWQRNRLVYQQQVSANPLQNISGQFEMTDSTAEMLIVVGRKQLKYSAAPEANDLSRPVDAPKDFDWSGPYGLYTLAREAMDQKNFAQAEQYLLSCLGKEKNFLPALNKMAQLMYRNMRYADALGYAMKALSIDSHDGESNYYYGLINRALGKTIDAKDGFGLATLSYPFRSAAYTQLSAMNLADKEYEEAIAYARRSLEFNTTNIEAMQLMALSFRRLHNAAAAKEVLSGILKADPLNHFAHFEQFLWDNTAKAKSAFTSLIRNELPHETYLELATWYWRNDGDAEAITLLDLAPSNAEIIYWQSFLKGQALPADKLDAHLVFPFRNETATILESIIKSSDHWMPKYHLALIYKDRNRVTEAMQLLHACGSRAAYAPYYVTKAAIHRQLAKDSVLDDLKQAYALDSGWRYTKLLAECYLEQQRYPEALEVSSSFYHKHPEQYIMGMLYARALISNQRYQEADAVLSAITVIPFEGATEGREFFREAKLMQAIEALKNGKATTALQFIEASRQYPENLGVGKPYEDQIDQRLEWWLEWQCRQGKKPNTANDSLLYKITRFEPRVDNTVRNFHPANELITAWAYAQLGQSAAAREWLNRQVVDYPDNRIIQWDKSVYEGQTPIALLVTEKDTNVRLIEALLKQRN